MAGKDKTFSLVTDLGLLRKKIEQIGNVVLIIIDPVSAYLGVGKVDGRSASDVRGTLTPMKDMAEELNVAVIGIAHFNKKDDVKSALLRVSDSIAWVAAARHVYAVLDDPEDKNSKLFIKAKNNIARRDVKALRYGMGVKKVGYDAKLGVDIMAPHIIWHLQHVDITANEAMQAAGGHTAKREAREFLLERLAAGRVKGDDIVAEAAEEGIAERTLRRAKKELGVKSYKEKGKTDGDWFWELPKAATHPPQRERVGHLPNVRGLNMLLLLDIFEGGQHGHPLSVGHLPTWWPSSLAVPRSLEKSFVHFDPAGRVNPRSTLPPQGCATSPATRGVANRRRRKTRARTGVGSRSITIA